jgi:N-dimethylarginine dimethylaminohydrolase
MTAEPRPRRYLMCAPEHFAVEYAINPWMDPTQPVDAVLARRQWEELRETLTGLGHTIDTLPPVAGLPDMVFAANGAFTVDGIAYGARFRFPQRTAEAAAHRHYYEADPATWKFVAPQQTNEGEGDFAYVPRAHGGLVLAGYGFRTEPAAHAEVQDVLGRPVVSLRLVDPRLYHLDTALAAIDDAMSFGLNLVSDGRHVVLPAEAVGLAAKLTDAGYVVVPVELGEFKKGGGSVKCCIAELRP